MWPFGDTMSKVKIVTGKDGKLSTENDDSDIESVLKQTRREVKDIIAGNIQFHEDPFSDFQDTQSE